MAIDQSVEFDFYRVHQDKKEDYKYQQYGQFIDVNVFQFGREKCRPSHSFGPAVRNHYLFHYILSGRGTLESTDRLGRIHSHQIGPGEGFMIVPQQINTYQADKEDPWEYIWLEFDGACISQPLFAAGLDLPSCSMSSSAFTAGPSKVASNWTSSGSGVSSLSENVTP